MVMQRRKVLRYAGAGLLSAWGAGLLADRGQAQTGGISVQSLGHTCFLISGGGQRVLVNPFKSIGCTAGLPAPKVAADLVMISSQLLDEGFVEIVPGNPRLLYEPGAYQVSNIKIQGVNTDHDRVGGKRFGNNVAWRWIQGGITILHLGGIASPISLEQKILMGTPDVAFVPVGGSAKAYTPEEAKEAIKVLNPKIVIPMHYKTSAAKGECDLTGLDPFLSLMTGTPVRRMGRSTAIGRADLPKDGMVIQVMA
jgi:L-ascorbate metabolism protein UlaG (beta-lactamase superfamily)